MIAFNAIKFEAEHGFTPGCGRYPGSINPGGIMAHMLAMAAGKLGDPVLFLIPMIAGDRLSHE